MKLQPALALVLMALFAHWVRGIPAHPQSRDECTCAFIRDAGVVPVTPERANGGWALSPDQKCRCRSYCPYACPAGFFSGQWNPQASYPTMDGGIYCDASGKVTLPRPWAPLCEDGRGEVRAWNVGSAAVMFCQTVMPGNEAMLHPSEVGAGRGVQLAIPDGRAFGNHGAHYYINAPGVRRADACAWGSGEHAQGNWAPYVVGINREPSDGRLYVSLGWNPVFSGAASRFAVPPFGVRIYCIAGGCEGGAAGQCAIDPRRQALNQVHGSSANGADEMRFCSMSALAGTRMAIEVFPA